MELRLLVVDNAKDNADILGMLLRELGHRNVTVAYSGEEALSMAESGRCNVLLLDLGMPQMSGFEVCRRVRRHATLRDSAVFAVTGWEIETFHREALDAGFDGFYVKPLDGSRLGALLQHASKILEVRSTQLDASKQRN